MRTSKIAFVYGTRPELIKLASLIKYAQDNTNWEVKTVATGQHTDLIDNLGIDWVKCDYQCVPVSEGRLSHRDRTPDTILAHCISELGLVFAQLQPELVLVHGDTTSTLAGALAAFHADIPVAHIEAGLRSHDPRSPFPEEMNRKLVAQIAEYHFAPTYGNKLNLLEENARTVPPNPMLKGGTVYVTGNTIYETIDLVADKIPKIEEFPGKRVILVTCHRRENWDKLNNVSRALKLVLAAYEDVEMVFPSHPNPRIRAAFTELDQHPRFHLRKPLPYLEMLGWLERSHFVISDSGGIVEEAPFFGSHVVVLRENTEREEAFPHYATAVGTDVDKIVGAATKILELESKDYHTFNLNQRRRVFSKPDCCKTIIETLELAERFGAWGQLRSKR